MVSLLYNSVYFKSVSASAVLTLAQHNGAVSCTQTLQYVGLKGLFPAEPLCFVRHMKCYMPKSLTNLILTKHLGHSGSAVGDAECRKREDVMFKSPRIVPLLL